MSNWGQGIIVSILGMSILKFKNLDDLPVVPQLWWSQIAKVCTISAANLDMDLTFLCLCQMGTLTDVPS